MDTSHPQIRWVTDLMGADGFIADNAAIKYD